MLFIGPARQARGIRVTRTLGDPVTDVVDRVVAGHILLLQEICRVRLALGEDRDQHVGAGHLLATRRLDVERRPLHDALEAVRRLGLFLAVDDEVLELRIEIVNDGLAQPVEVDAAGPEHRRRVDVVDQRQKQMLERRIFVTALIGERERPTEGLFERAGENRHRAPFTSFP